MDSLTLNCWIRSENPRGVFQIKISKTDTVYDLQKAIKNEKLATFRDVDADVLTLYKSNGSLSKPYKEKLGEFILAEHAECLDGVDKLSTVFSEPPSELDIHVIVDAPLTIVCWLRGADLDQSFPVSIQPGEGIDRLRPRIKDEQTELRNKSNDLIRLYKISGEEDELKESLIRNGDGELLRRGPLTDHFLDVPVLDPLCVVVEVVAPPTSTNPSVLWHQVIAGEDRIAAARSDFLNARPYKAPSSASKSAEFRVTQGTADTRIPCGRPRLPEELIPVTLLHPVFGQFGDDCLDGLMIEDDNNFVRDVANAVSSLQPNENARVDVVNNVFRLYHVAFDVKQDIPDTQCTMDASLSVNNPELPIPYFIGEFKYEVGSTTSEPFMQAVAYYLEATRKHAAKHSRSPLPCFLLIVFGPYMVFAGAVWNLRPVVQTLSLPVPFSYHSSDSRVQLMAARHMAAFRKALRTLKAHYEDVSRGVVRDHPSGEMLFPYPTTFNALEDGSAQSFFYTEQFIDRDGDKSTLLFFGELKDDPTVKICIKFSQRYSKDAHVHCANSGFAPKLRGFDVLPGGWFMIVMDRVKYRLLSDFGKERVPRSLFDTIGTHLETLHDRRLVHGDIRDTNVFISDDRKNFMIVDFDWSGVQDNVRYPPYVNWREVVRPTGARDGLLITKAHDLDMLRFMIEKWAATN